MKEKAFIAHIALQILFGAAFRINLYNSKKYLYPSLLSLLPQYLKRYDILIPPLVCDGQGVFADVNFQDTIMW